MKANIQEPTNLKNDLATGTKLDGVLFFSQAITELSKHHNQYFSRLLRSDLLNMQTECGLCSAPFVSKSFPVVSLIIPVEHGGTQELGNAFLACKRCNEHRGTSDLLSLGERFSCQAASASERSYDRVLDFSPAALLARRLEILSRSANHWTPHTRNSVKHVVRAHLDKRWSEPRIRVFAHRSSNLALVGFGSRSGDAQSLGAARVLTKFLGADALPMDGFGQVFQVAPAQFLPLIWSLIEINALVVPVDIPETERLALGDNWQDFWTDHVRSLSALGTRLRPGNAIDRQAFDRCPAAPRVLSQTRNSIQKREAYAPIKAMKESQRLTLFHQKRIDEATRSGDFLAVIEARLASLIGTEISDR